MKEKYLLNGKTFDSYSEALTYYVDNHFRICNTVTISTGIFLLTAISIK